MQRVIFDNVVLGTKRFTGWPRTLRWVLFGIFLVQFAFVWARLWLPSLPFQDARWPEGVLAVVTAATVVASLTRQLPGQNVILASLVIAVIAGAVQTLGALSGIPFGPYVYTERIGPQLFYPLPWAVPTIWLVAILTSRGVARLILRPWRKARAYGYWLIGLTASLVVLFDLALEPFATRVKHYWSWNATKISLDWYGAPLVNFFGWALTALLILAFATPALVNKKPVKLPPDSRPLVVWLLMNLLFLTGAATHQLWPAVAVAGAGSIVAATLAIRGARR